MKTAERKPRAEQRDSKISRKEMFHNRLSSFLEAIINPSLFQGLLIPWRNNLAHQV